MGCLLALAPLLLVALMVVCATLVTIFAPDQLDEFGELLKSLLPGVAA